MKIADQPYVISAFYPNMEHEPQRFYMSMLDPAIDAARAISKDDAFWEVKVINTYNYMEHARFSREAPNR